MKEREESWIFSQKRQDYVDRYQEAITRAYGGDRSGKFVLNLLPSGILHPTAVCVLGNGMVIDPSSAP